jgi:ABC-2 type transport system ATP-binding protein
MLQVGRVPETLRVREHIDLFSSYYPTPMPLAEVLAAAGLEKVADRKFGDLSGGQRQRVLFALAICGDPDLLFLDEPTVGLDVEARRMLWDEIRRMVTRGKTVLLTTHYLQEADALADRIAVLDRGRIVAEGSAAQLKATVAGRRLVVRCVNAGAFDHVLARAGERAVERDRPLGTLALACDGDGPVVRALLDELDPDRSRIADFSVRTASLDDVFLTLTGHSPESEITHE